MAFCNRCLPSAGAWSRRLVAGAAWPQTSPQVVAAGPWPGRGHRDRGVQGRLPRLCQANLSTARVLLQPQEDRSPETTPLPGPEDGSSVARRAKRTAAGGEGGNPGANPSASGSEASDTSVSKEKDSSPGPWPYLSDIDMIAASSLTGEHWPFQPTVSKKKRQETLRLRQDEKDSSPLSVTLLTRFAFELTDEERESLKMALRSDVPSLLPSYSDGVLAGLFRGLLNLNWKDELTDLFRRTSGELLQRRPLRTPHAALLLSALRLQRGAEQLAASAVLRAAAEAFSSPESERLGFAEATAAFEGLAAVRARPLDTTVDELVGPPAIALSAQLNSGPGIAAVLTGRAREKPQGGLMLRFLAALQPLPEALGQGTVAKWLFSLNELRVPHALSGVSEEQVAAAACMLARCGRWERGLLLQAVKRDIARRPEPNKPSSSEPELPELEDADSKTEPAEKKEPTPVTGAAASLWLCALANTGNSFDSALGKDSPTPIPERVRSRVEEVILNAVEALAAEKTPNPAAAARALWGLCAMGKTEERGGLGQALLGHLASAQPSSFSAETWALLREVQQTMAPSPAPAPAAAGEEEAAAEAAAEGSSENAAAEDGQKEAAAGFGPPSWQDAFEQASIAEARRLEVSERLPQLLDSLGTSDEVGEAVVGELEENFAVGPYTLAVRVGSHEVAVDFDTCESFTSRALRRQQWEALTGGLRVAEVTLREWDGATGLERKALLRRRLLGLPDPVEEEDD